MLTVLVCVLSAMSIALSVQGVARARRIRRLEHLTYRLLYGAQRANITLKAHLTEGHVLVRLCHLEIFTSGSMPNFERTAALLQGAKLITYILEPSGTEKDVDEGDSR